MSGVYLTKWILYFSDNTICKKISRGIIFAYFAVAWLSMSSKIIDTLRKNPENWYSIKQFYAFLPKNITLKPIFICILAKTIKFPS